MEHLFQYSDDIQSFDYMVNNKICKYTGSKRKLRFIQYLCETTDSLLDHHYKQLFETIDQSNIDQSIYFLDKIFFDGFLLKNGWLDQIELQFKPLPNLISGSTIYQDNKSIITINTPMFEDAINQMQAANGTSVGFDQHMV